jgi:hypothetical protein
VVNIAQTNVPILGRAFSLSNTGLLIYGMNRLIFLSRGEKALLFHYGFPRGTLCLRTRTAKSRYF